MTLKITQEQRRKCEQINKQILKLERSKWDIHIAIGELEQKKIDIINPQFAK